MRTKTQFYLLVTLLLFLFLQCKKDLDELPSNIDILVDILNVNQATLSAEVDNVGDLKILGAGFYYAEKEFNCGDNVLEIEGSYDANTKQITASRDAINLLLDTNYYFRAYVELENPNTKQKDKICSDYAKEESGKISLGTSFENTILGLKLTFSIFGLEGDAKIEEYGHIWLESSEKLDMGALSIDFDNPNINLIDLSREGIITQDTSFIYTPSPKFEKGKFYYVRAYAKYENKTILLDDIIEVFTGDFWERINTLPNPEDACRFGAVAFSVGGYGFYGTGKWFEKCRLDNQFAKAHRNDFWRYDPIANEWTEIAPFPGAPREDASAFVIGDRAFVGLGRTSSRQFNDFWEYDFIQDVWTEKDSFPVYRRSAMSFVINEEGYVGTGYSCDSDGCYLSRRLYKFLDQDVTKGLDSLGKPKGNWVRKALLPSPDMDGTGTGRRSASGFAIGNKGYMTLGLGSNNFRSDIWEYDPTKGDFENGERLGTWTRMAELPASGREQGIAFSIGEYGYAGLGGQYGIPTDVDFWQFNPSSEEEPWTRLADVGQLNTTAFRRQDAVSFVIDGTAYVGSGNITENIEVADNQFYKYIPNP